MTDVRVLVVDDQTVVREGLTTLLGSTPRRSPAYRSVADALRLLVDDGVRIRELVDRYRDLPLGGTDASIVAIAERLKARRLATVDRPHFTVVRPSHVEAFELVAPPA